MRKLLNSKWMVIGMRLVVGGIFIYAGAVKVQAPQAFADSIATFQLLPTGLIGIVALALPVMEIITGLALIVGFFQRRASFAALIMALLFGIALGSALFRGLEVDCGCFGSGTPSVWKTWNSLGRDLILFATTLFIYFRQTAHHNQSSGAEIN